MSDPDAPKTQAPPAAPRTPGLAGHLGRIFLLCAALLAGAFAGALFAALVARARNPLVAALDRSDDVSDPLLLVAGVAVLFPLLRVFLGEGMARRRRLVRLRRRVRGWIRLAPLLWMPAIAVLVFADGGTLLVALMGPIIAIGLAWAGASLSGQSLRAGPLTYAVAAVLGLAFGLFA